MHSAGGILSFQFKDWYILQWLNSLSKGPSYVASPNDINWYKLKQDFVSILINWGNFAIEVNLLPQKTKMKNF